MADFHFKRFEMSTSAWSPNFNLERDYDLASEIYLVRVIGRRDIR